jgi:hypothetical protein
MTVSDHQRSIWRLDLAGACKEFAERDQEAVCQRNGFMFPRLVDVDEVNRLASGQLALQFAYMDSLYQGGPRTHLQFVAPSMFIILAVLDNTLSGRLTRWARRHPADSDDQDWYSVAVLSGGVLWPVSASSFNLWQPASRQRAVRLRPRVPWPYLLHAGPRRQATPWAGLPPVIWR